MLTPPQERFAREQRVGRLATADAAGRPHAVPVCYAYVDGAFYLPLDEKPKVTEVRRLRRVRNVLENPAAALVIDRWDEEWSRLAYLLVRGPAALLEPGGREHARAVTALRERYPQYRAMALERAPMIRLTPERVTAWGAVPG